MWADRAVVIGTVVICSRARRRAIMRRGEIGVLVPRTGAAGGVKTGHRRRVAPPGMGRRRFPFLRNKVRFNQDRHRVTVRLSQHPYTQGTYFVTTCSFGRQALFSNVCDGVVIHTQLGHIVEDEWRRLQSTRLFVQLGEYVIMPDHFHAIITLLQSGRIWLDNSVEPASMTKRRFSQATPQSLQSLIGQFKSRATKRINSFRQTPGSPVWQSGFYEHVVRDSNDLDRIRRYIVSNPTRWQQNRP